MYRLRGDPAFRLASGRLPDGGGDLCSQPTVAHWKNAPGLRTVIRLTYATVDAWCAIYDLEPEAVTLDIGDTLDVAHSDQQLSLFRAHHDERCFLPIHIHDTITGRRVAMMLRQARPHRAGRRRDICAGSIARIRSHWPNPPDDPRGPSLWPARADGLL